MSAAAAAKRQDKDTEVVVYERGMYISYGACGLPYFISNREQSPEDLLSLTPESALAEKGVIVKTGHEVTGIDPVGRTITVKDQSAGTEVKAGYDRLIIATGATPLRPEIPGIDSEKVFFLRNLNDGIRLKDYIWTDRPSSAVIIGDGHIGLEAAEAFRLCGVENVTMISRHSHICWWLDADIAAIVEKKAADNGIKIIKQAVPSAVSRPVGRLSVETDKGAFECDFIFVSLGMKPNSELAVKAGLKTGMRGSIAVNNYMETSAPGVYAAGDCADVFNLVENARIYMPRGTTANKQGRYAGINAAGGRQQHKGVTGLMAFKFFDLEVGRVGIDEEDAARKKIASKSAMIKSVTRAGYYPGGKRIFVKLTREKESGRFLGGQIAGGEGVAKRMDILSTALYNKMTVEEMKQLDLSYSPPFAPVWDPVLIAVNKLSKEGQE